MNLIRQRVLKASHRARNHRACTCAVGKDEIRDPYFARQISPRHYLAVLVGERKLRYLAVIDFRFSCASKQEKAERDQCKSFHDDVCLVRRIPAANTHPENARETANDSANDGRFMAAARCTP